MACPLKIIYESHVMKKLIFVFVSLFFGNFESYCQISDSIARGQEYNSLGYELMMDGNIKEAIHQFDYAILLDPNNANYYHNRAYCYFELDSINLSTSDYLKAIELNQWNYAYYYLIGNNYQRLNKFETAIQHYSKALSLIESIDTEDTYLILFNRGNCYLKTDNYSNALSDYNHSYELNPYHPPTNANRGIAKFRQNDTIGACYDWYISLTNNVGEVNQYYRAYCLDYDFSDSLPATPHYTDKNVNDEFDDLSLVPEKPNEPMEILPEFPGGDNARIKYLNDNVKYPPNARERGIQGKVIVSFLVEADGSLSDIKVLKGIGAGCDEEAIRVVENMPKWTPGIQNGNAVCVRMNISIQFRVFIYSSYIVADFDNIEEIMEAITQLDFGGADLNYDRGIKNMDQGYYQTASKYFSKSIKREGYMINESYANRAVCNYKLGNIEEAKKDYEIAKSFNNPIIDHIISAIDFEQKSSEKN
jgi:TonB family protein